MMVPVLFSLLLIHLSTCNLINDNCIQPALECPNTNITFWLYKSDTQEDPYQIKVNDPSMENAVFLKNVPTIILIHGYTGSRDYDPNPQIRPEYFKHGEYNVISVDYNPLVKEPCYVAAAANVPLVGMCSAQLLDEIVTTKEVPLESIHVIGFSLGAQVSGAIANNLKSGRLTRITGLDPAMPLFVTPETDKKLDKSDAKFVDVIHTNALDKGKLEALGHVDFYVNGGMRQPGCENVDKSAEASCNHARAPAYYGESINSHYGFYGKKCSSWFLFIIGLCRFDDKTEEVEMGINTPNTTEGLFFVKTSDRPPYARGKLSAQDLKSYNDLMQNETMSELENQYYNSNIGVINSVW